MPRFDAPRRLTRSEVAQVLRGISDPPPSVPISIAMEALAVTATELASWCDPVFVTASLAGPPLELHFA